jgi:hypothetical protein
MHASADLAARLWRVRKRHNHIDAVLHDTPLGWQLEFSRNDRQMVAWSFDDEQAARREADRHLRELQRAGWTVHW